MSPLPSDIAFQVNEWALPQAKKALANGFFIEAVSNYRQSRGFSQ